MQVQTVFKSGNSDVVAIPSEVKKKTGIKSGSEVVVSATTGGTIFISRADNKGERSSITPEFLRWLDEFNKEYGPALKKLAEK